MNQDLTFGAYIRQRRREMDLTQEELARRVGCAAITLRKIEANDLRASVQIAERLAMALAIPLDERGEFVRRARAVRPESAELPPVTPAPTMEEIGGEDLTGRAIRGYALAERIGMGGMGSVYRAVQPNVEREVAIKIILPAFANHPDFIRRFEAEAQLVARLEHPHIVPLYDYWREPGVAYLVMRLLRGGSVQNLMKQGPLTIEVIAHMLEQICSALHAAHRIGVIHRDLKPANVLLDEDNNAYLADFGIAKNLGDPDFENQTQVDAMIGSPQYMSPEQIRSLSVRPQTDIYCLGVMLYEMLTGALPFTGPTPFDMIQQHVNTPMPPLSARQAGLPAALDAVIGRATAKDTDQRYEDALSLFNDFRQAIGRMVEARPLAITYEEEETGLEVANPFKGLRAFNEADAENFFGRETMIQQLLARLGEGGDLSRFLAVIGPSGSGKSSVVRAGLIPALRRGGLPGSENWFVVDMLPGKHPFEELEASLLRVAVNPPQSLLSQLKDGNRGLLRAVHRILPADDSVELVLVIDQFEEIFTLVEDESERALLLESIATAVMDERSRLRVIVTLRADFTDKPLRYVDFGEMMNRRFEFILPLNADEVERAVAGPAQRVGLKLEKGLVSTIIREAGNQPGALPLLQHALSELFEKREGRTLMNKAYQEIGGVLGALGRSAEAIYSKLDEASQAAARQMFLRLVTLGEGTADTRRRVLRTELEGLTSDSGWKIGDGGRLSVVMEAFGRGRLLSFDRDPITRGATSEVAHEALLREWTRLSEWLNESRADVRLQRQLALAAHDWAAANQDISFLLTGTRLEQFEGWAAITTIALTQDERAFLDASINERDRRASEERARQQRELVNLQKLAETEKQRAEEQSRAATQLRKRAYYLNGALVIALIMVVVAIIFNRQAQTANQTATSRELASASAANLEVDPELSILLALEALSTTHTREAEDALHRAVFASRVEMNLRGHEGAVGVAVYSPDGKRIVTAGEDGKVIFWDAESGENILTLSGHEGPVNEVIFTSDGKRVATSSNDGTARLWDAVNGEMVMMFEGQQGDIIGLAFSPDEKQLATGGFNGSVILWDIESGAQVYQRHAHDDVVISVAFTPDGKQLLTAGFDARLIFWDVASGEQLQMWGGEFGDLTFDKDGGYLTAGFSEGAKIWDVAGGEEVVKTGGHTNLVFTAGINPAWTRIATSGLDRKVVISDAETGRTLFILSGHTAEVLDLHFSPDGKYLVTASADGTARVWNVGPARETLTIETKDSYGRIAFSPNGKMIAGTDEQYVKVWDVGSGIERFSFEMSALTTGVAFDPNGDRVAGATEAGDVAVWNLRSGALEWNIKGSDRVIGFLAFSPDGTKIAGGGEESLVMVWDSNNGDLLLSLVRHRNPVTSVAFSPDGKWLASSGVDNIAIVWDAVTGERLLTLSGHTDVVWSVMFSPDGKRIATASRDGTVRIWDATSGQELLMLTGHISTVVSVFFSPDGSQLASTGRDGVTKIWEVDTGELLLNLHGDGQGLNGVAISPDGTRIATAGTYGLRVYLLHLDDLVALAKSRLTRSLTTEECQKYLHVETCPASP
jgi:WD40 repeat protein/transcriptional regulator with XRE-family HTH domain